MNSTWLKKKIFSKGGSIIIFVSAVVWNVFKTKNTCSFSTILQSTVYLFIFFFIK